MQLLFAYRERICGDGFRMASWSVALLVGGCLGIGGVVPHGLKAQRALGAGKRPIDYRESACRDGSAG